MRIGTKRAGFALLAVIWGTGIIATLVVAFMTSGRLRLQMAQNIAQATSAAYVADGAINLAALALLRSRDATTARAREATYDGAPQFCVLDRAAVALAIEDESGKIDLNAATPELLQTVLTGLGVEERAARAIAQAIVEFRTAPAGATLFATESAADKPIEPKRGLFETALELDQVGGIDPALFRALLPFVTVHSKSPGVNPRASPPALFAALAGYPADIVRQLAATPYPNGLNRKDGRFPANISQMADAGAYLIHAEALLATGQIAVREALVDLRPTNGKPFAFKEIRRGTSRYAERLRAMIAANGAGAPDC